MISLITFRTYIEIPLQVFEIKPLNLDKDISNNTAISSYIFLISLLLMYCLGLLIMGIRFIKNLAHTLLKVKINSTQKRNGLTIVLVNEEVAPYSFLKYVFVNKQKYLTNSIPEEVFIHEKTHITQKHSIDIILIEIAQIIFWFNPIFYYVKKAIKLNHEFLADAAVLKQGVEIKKYQNSLLSFFTYPQQKQLVSSFTYSSTEKRFLIMNKKLNRKTAYLKLVIIIPLLIFLLSSFSNKVTVQVPIENTLVPKTKVNVSAIPEIYHLIDLNAEFTYKNKKISHSEVRELIKARIDKKREKLNFIVSKNKSNKIVAKLFSTKNN